VHLATHIANAWVEIGEVATEQAIDCFTLMPLQQLVKGIGIRIWTWGRFGWDYLASVVALRIVRNNEAHLSELGVNLI